MLYSVPFMPCIIIDVGDQHLISGGAEHSPFIRELDDGHVGQVNEP